MRREIGKEWRLRRRDLLFFAVVSALVWIVGILLQMLVVKALGNPRVVPLASIMTTVCMAGMSCMGFGADWVYNFDLALSFGRTRKRFLLYSSIVYFLCNVILLLEMKIFLEAELLFWKGGFLRLEAEKSIGDLLMSQIAASYTSIAWIPAYGALLTGIACAGGAVVHRFRGKGGAVLLLLWFVMCLLIPKSEVSAQVTRVLSFYGSLSMSLQFLLVLLLGLSVWAIGAFSMRKGRVY